MAAEAVLKVKEAEEKGSELIRKSNEEAKEIIKRSGFDGEKKRKAIVNEACKTKEKIIEMAVNKAALECSELIKKGSEEKANILNPEKKKFERAVSLVVERIVNQ